MLVLEVLTVSTILVEALVLSQVLVAFKILIAHLGTGVILQAVMLSLQTNASNVISLQLL